MSWKTTQLNAEQIDLYYQERKVYFTYSLLPFGVEIFAKEFSPALSPGLQLSNSLQLQEYF